MRHVVYLLLVANLLYLGWNLSRSEVESDPRTGWPALPATASPLVTLDEMQQQSATGMEQSAAESQPQPVEIAATTEPEVPAQESAADAVQVECLQLGPFGLHEELRSVASRFDSLGLETRERADEVQEQNGYWVYLPFKKRADARKVIALLKKNGDRDHFLGRDNIIALGTFSDLARAEHRQGQLGKLGLDTLVAPHTVARKTWWLESQQPDSDVMEEILQQHPDLQLRTMACP